jgi:hypothetical protein
MDYREYYPVPLPDSHVIIVDDSWLPVHAIGLPVLVAPTFALAGRAGVAVALALMTVVGVRLLWSALRGAAFGPRAAGVATVAACFTLPLASLSGQVYPEVPAFALIALALWAILAAPGWRVGSFALAMSLAVLPWLHPKYVLVGGALLIAAVLVPRPQLRIRAVAVAGAVFAVSVAAVALLSLAWYGAPLPGAANISPRSEVEQDWLARIAGHFLVDQGVGLFGVLLDQQSGLFMAGPVHALAIPGLIVLARARRGLAAAGAVLLLSVYLPAGLWGVWHAEGSSPARFLAPAVPALALGLCALLSTAGRPARVSFAVLAGVAFVHAYAMTTLPSFTRYGDPATHHNFFVATVERLSGLDLTPLFPSFRHITAMTWVTAAAYLTALTVVTVTLVRWDRGRPMPGESDLVPDGTASVAREAP